MSDVGSRRTPMLAVTNRATFDVVRARQARPSTEMRSLTFAAGQTTPITFDAASEVTR